MRPWPLARCGARRAVEAGSLPPLTSQTSRVPHVLRDSSLLLDQRRSGLNGMLVAEATRGRWANASLFEINDVCDSGLALARALRQHAVRVAPR